MGNNDKAHRLQPDSKGQPLTAGTQPGCDPVKRLVRTGITPRYLFFVLIHPHVDGERVDTVLANDEKEVKKIVMENYKEDFEGVVFVNDISKCRKIFIEDNDPYDGNYCGIIAKMTLEEVISRGSENLTYLHYNQLLKLHYEHEE